MAQGPATLAELARELGAREPEHVVRIGKRSFFDPQGTLEIARRLGWDAFSVGLYLGEERHGFHPSSALVELLAREVQGRIVVDEKAAWLFLCGKDILMQGVVLEGEFAKGSLAIVADSHGDVLGYGRVTSSFHRKAKHRQYVKNLLDKGEYLRRER